MRNTPLVGLSLFNTIVTKDAFWYAMYGSKVGYISFRELEEESECEQEKLQNSS